MGKAQVIASRLNVRQGPSAQAALIRAPLDYGHALHILAEQDGWYQVVIEEQGWVKKEWVERLNV
nr:SH3 domain-containing protein [Vibrio stylophorae]